ncbi:MAG: 50S ribosomal protein L15 [Planctomycetota bacterium]
MGASVDDVHQRDGQGAGQRAGKSKRIGFEGGQTEIYRRFPLRGFSNKPFETKYHGVNISMLNRFDDGTTVDRDLLKQAGLIPNKKLGVKILGHGTLDKKLTVTVDAYTRTAYKAITDKGGEAKTAKGEAYEFNAPKTERLEKKMTKRLGDKGIDAGSLPTKAKPESKKGRNTDVSKGAKVKAELDAKSSD